MISHPELGSDHPIGSDWESGCDKSALPTKSDARNENQYAKN